MTVHLFTYGTLRTGDARWPLLAPYVAGPGVEDSVDGELFDTGLGYPAAIFGRGRSIIGETFELLLATVHECLAILDEEEDTVDGLYRRTTVRTDRGVAAWAYSYGNGLQLTPIESGDWFDHIGRRPTA
jgi:gamma-glutamylcyclotransferase (GGCT)/AIG2-like uncharacterized protein YtfP